jgi:hypothetical protein
MRARLDAERVPRHSVSSKTAATPSPALYSLPADSESRRLFCTQRSWRWQQQHREHFAGLQARRAAVIPETTASSSTFRCLSLWRRSNRPIGIHYSLWHTLFPIVAETTQDILHCNKNTAKRDAIEKKGY